MKLFIKEFQIDRIRIYSTYDHCKFNLCLKISLKEGISLRNISSPLDYTVWNASSVILRPSYLPKVIRLVVFLSGTGASPDKYSRLLKSAQFAGNYVIGLPYLSQPFPVSQSNAWCTSSFISNPSDCNSELHELVLFGNTPPDFEGASQDIWDVDPKYSVVKLLNNTLHNVDWGKLFLKYNAETDSHGIDWEKVIISGHSQGAGHAAYLSYKKNIPAVLFSGPQDCVECSQEWLRIMSNQNILRRAMFHMNEECGPNPLDAKSECELNLMLINLGIMGMKSSKFHWNNNSSIPETLETVISMRTPTCEQGRTYHNSIALDKCASENIERIWIVLFSNFA